jgi:hypothetical protein
LWIRMISYDIYTPHLLIHLDVDGHLSWLCILAILIYWWDNDMRVQMSLQIPYLIFYYILKNGNSELCGSSQCN